MSSCNLPHLFVFQLSVDDFTRYAESSGNETPFLNVQASITISYGVQNQNKIMLETNDGDIVISVTRQRLFKLEKKPHKKFKWQ